MKSIWHLSYNNPHICTEMRSPYVATSEFISKRRCPRSWNQMDHYFAAVGEPSPMPVPFQRSKVSDFTVDSDTGAVATRGRPISQAALQLVWGPQYGISRVVGVVPLLLHSGNACLTNAAESEKEKGRKKNAKRNHKPMCQTRHLVSHPTLSLGRISLCWGAADGRTTLEWC